LKRAVLLAGAIALVALNMGVASATIDRDITWTQMGGSGSEAWLCDMSGTGTFYEYAKGSSGDDSLVFTAYGDDNCAKGLAGNDIIYGEDVSTLQDVLFGQGGADDIFGYDGVDVLHGGAGNDYIEGNAVTDYLYGGNGDDEIYGGASADDIFGGDMCTENPEPVGSPPTYYGAAGIGTNYYPYDPYDFDRSDGWGGDDLTYYPDIYALPDCSAAVGGADTIYAGGGDDYIWEGNSDNWSDGEADYIDCGAGDSDHVEYGPEDTVVNCELDAVGNTLSGSTLTEGPKTPGDPP